MLKVSSDLTSQIRVLNRPLFKLLGYAELEIDMEKAT